MRKEREKSGLLRNAQFNEAHFLQGKIDGAREVFDVLEKVMTMLKNEESSKTIEEPFYAS